MRTAPRSVVPIGSVQGAGAASPLAGSVVRIEGTVVADFQTTDLDGFYLQDAGDGDSATSDGIFVFQQDGDNAPGNGDGIIDVSVGDVVNVAGAVSEFQGLTEVTAADTEVCETGTAALSATPLTLPLEDSAREAVEGMLVTFAQPLTIAEYFEFGRFNTITVSPERLFQPTAVVEPGSPEQQALAASNVAAQLIVDDARGRQNPDPLIHPNGEPYSLDNLFRGGDVLTGVTGVLDQRVRTGDSPQISSYGIQPTVAPGYQVVNPRPAVPEVGGDLKVSSFNVLNYFTTLDSRGANSAYELERQQAKIVAALAAIDADVFGLMEIENNGGAEVPAVATLAAALNAHLGADVYSYVDTGEAIGTDVIATAFLYKTATVSPLGDPAWKIDDPRWAANRNRPPLTQTFQAAAGGEPVTISVNHLKSKGSGCGAADPDLGDGQGECSLTRENAAAALVDWLAKDPTGQGTGDRTLIIGDLNSYDKEDSIDVFTAAGYTDMLLAYQGEYAYSYVFDGQLGYLDHALAGPGLVADVTGASTWAINADEAQVLDYNVEFKPASQVTGLYAPDPFRSSDHDPVLVGIDLDTTPPTLSVTASPEVVFPPNGKERTVTVSVVAEDDSGDDVTVELVSARGIRIQEGGGDQGRRHDLPGGRGQQGRLRVHLSGDGCRRQQHDRDGQGRRRRRHRRLTRRSSPLSASGAFSRGHRADAPLRSGRPPFSTDGHAMDGARDGRRASPRGPACARRRGLGGRSTGRRDGLGVRRRARVPLRTRRPARSARHRAHERPDALEDELRGLWQQLAVGVGLMGDLEIRSGGVVAVDTASLGAASDRLDGLGHDLDGVAALFRRASHQISVVPGSDTVYAESRALFLASRCSGARRRRALAGCAASRPRRCLRGGRAARSARGGASGR